MDYKELKNLGLPEKEAKVYLAALELGQSTVQKIAEKAKVNRATTYVIIETLIQKGLMSSVYEDKKQFFYAESPEKLNLLFREQAMEIQRKQEYLDKILPNLKALKANDKEGPVVRYFEGKEGMRAIAEEIFDFKNGDEKLRMIYSYDLLLKMFTEEEVVEMRKRRQSKKINAVIITNDDKNRLKTDAEVIRIPSKEYKIFSDVAIFGNKIRIISQSGPSNGVIIENKEIANTFKILYDLALKQLRSEK
jgi:sugar-specific transcriptional regulator TrmB